MPNYGVRSLAILLSVCLVTGATAAEVDFSGRSLFAANHQGENLQGAKLVDADLTMTDFTGADLRRADFTRAKIDRTKFDGADLRKTTGWSKAIHGLGLSANDADFSGTDLREAKIVGGYSGGYFERADFSNADLTDAMLAGRFHGAKFEGATVRGALMLGADGIKALHDDLQKRGAIVTADDFSAAVKSGREFTAVRLHGVDLADADLRGAKLPEADLHSANLDRTRLANADLRKASLYWGHAAQACFDGANLSEAHLDSRQAEEASFENANLRKATLTSTNLRRANFRNADLSGADLSYADLTGADLTGAKLDGVIVEAAILDDVRGLGPDQARQMKHEAARWKHDLANAFEWFVSKCSTPLHLLITPLVLLVTALGLRCRRARVSFTVLMTINAAAAIPFCVGVLFGLMGGSPTAQMSSPSLWSAWFDLWRIMMSGLVALLVLSLPVGGFHLIRYVLMRPRERPLLSLAAALLTPANCFFAVGTLLLLAPDA